jgi:uncharacterized membrane protein YeaQ/YmgE (transglycosylase-associated protein family)
MISLIIAGAIGALVKDILQDGKISLPKKVNGDLVLGFIGSIIVGAFIGFLVDKDPVISGLAGYVGKSMIENLIPKNSYH